MEDQDRQDPKPSLDLNLNLHSIPIQDQIDRYASGSAANLLDLISNVHRASQNHPSARACLAHILRRRPGDLLAALRRALPHYLRQESATAVPRLKYFLVLCARNASVSRSRAFAAGLGEICSDLAGESPEWPLLVQFLRIWFRKWGSISEFDKESAMLLYSALASRLDELDDLNRLSEEVLCPAFFASMSVDQPAAIRAAATIAAASFLVGVARLGAECGRSEDLVIGIVQNLVGMVLSDQTQHAHKVFVEMSELAETSPMVFKHQTKPIGECVLLAVDNLCYDNEVLDQAVTFIAATAQEPTIFLGIISDVPHFTTRLLSLLLKVLGMVEENPKWPYLKGEDPEEDPEAEMVSLCPVGEGCLEKMVRALGQSAVMANLPEMLFSDLLSVDWECRHGALSFIAIAVARCNHGYDAMRAQAMAIFKLIEDPHPYVRGAAINAVAQFSVYLGRSWREHHHEIVLPALILALNDFQNPRVQMEAVSALHFFSKKCSSQILKPYLHGIVSKLLNLLQTSKKVLKEGALEALTSVASSSQEEFQECYKAVMPNLNAMLSLSKKDDILLGKLIACITHIGLAVGKEKFRDDMDKVIRILVTNSAQASGSEEKHILLKKFIIEAWGILCRCFGQDFQPYLSVAIPYLLKSVQVSTAGLVDKSSDNSNKGNNVNLLKEELWLRYIATADEKYTACVTLCCCAEELREDFYLWINEVACTLIPLMAWRDDLKNEIRDVAITAMQMLLQSSISAKNKGYLQGYYGSPLENLSLSILPALVEALKKEPLPNIRLGILDSLNGCMEISEPLLNGNFMGDTLTTLTTSWLKKIQGDEGKRDIDPGNRKRFKWGEQKGEIYYDKVVECFATLIQTHNIHLLPYSGLIFACLGRMWEDGSAQVRRIGMRMFRDLTEKYNADAFRSSDFHVLFDGCCSKQLGDRQIAVCAIGVAAEFGGDWFKPHVQGALSRLNLVIGYPDASRHIGHAVARDFAISALGKICQFHHDSLNGPQVMSTWLMYLPLKNDIDEAKAVHDRLCSLVEEPDSPLASAEHNFPRIIVVFAEILWESNVLATEQTVTRIIKQLKRLRGLLREVAWRNILSKLPPHLHNKLEHELFRS